MCDLYLLVYYKILLNNLGESSGSAEESEILELSQNSGEQISSVISTTFTFLCCVYVLGGI